MQDGKQLSTTSKQAVAVTTRETLQHSAVALRLYERTRTPDGLPLAAVAVVAAADRSIATAADSVRSTGQVSVKRFANDFGERTLSALILTHLTIVEDMLNPARPMKPEALAETAKKAARLVLDDDMTLTLADLQIVADRLANGEAGQAYGGLNAPMVMRAFAAYVAEKANAFADLREQQAKELYGSSFGQRASGSREAERLANHAAHLEYLKHKHNN